MLYSQQDTHFCHLVATGSALVCGVWCVTTFVNFYFCFKKIHKIYFTDVKGPLFGIL